MEQQQPQPEAQAQPAGGGVYGAAAAAMPGRGGGGGGAHSGSIGMVVVVLAVIAILGVVAGMVGRLCGGRRFSGDSAYDFEGWVERRCSTCIDGHLDSGVPDHQVPLAEVINPPPPG